MESIQYFVVQFDPFIFRIGNFGIRWYALSYIVGALAFWLIARYRLTRPPYRGFLTMEELETWTVWMLTLGLLGGRLGYGLVYGLDVWLHDPLWIFRIWEGGMSFHGGLVGICVGSLVMARRLHYSLVDLLDFAMPLGAIGLCLGRLANFVNGELWGRVTDVPWAMIFPMADLQPRHPSQLYEAFLEGVLLFLITMGVAHFARRRGVVFGAWLCLYALFRIFAELFREPDSQIGFLPLHLTMGQLLSFLMFVVGLWLFWRAYRAPVYLASIIANKATTAQAQKPPKKKASKKR